MSFHSEKLWDSETAFVAYGKEAAEASAHGGDLKVVARSLWWTRLCRGTAGFHFSLMSTSLCCVINSMSATVIKRVQFNE